MASFISALALFILVLSNGCFTLPIHNETLFSSTEQNTFGLQGTSTDETNVWKTQHSSTPFDTLVDNGKREFQNSFPSTTESVDDNKREFQESFSSSTQSLDNDKREFQDSFSSSTESLDNGKREFNDDVLLTTTEEPTENNVAGTTDSENLKREIDVESTTNDMLLFASTSSSVAPQLYTSKSVTATRKYIGSLPFENDENKEHKSEEPEAEAEAVTEAETEAEPEVTTKRPLTPKKVTKKFTEAPELESTDKVTYENEVQENLKESTLPIAVQDQKALDGIQYSGNYVMQLDTDTTMVVTDASKEFSKSPKQFTKSPKQIETTEMPLNQGTESSYPEAEEQNN